MALTRIQQVADGLAAARVERVFGLLGNGNVDLVADLTARHGTHYVAARHEAGAVAMADGQARATGEVAVCTTTQGPGLTNATTALITAARSRSRVLLVVGDPAGSNARTNQRLDHGRFIAATDVEFIDVGTRDDWAAATRAALAAAHLRTVVLNLPIAGMDGPAGGPVPTAGPAAPPADPEPDPDAVREVARLLRGARRPLLLAGRGATSAAARDALIRLAEATGAALVTSLAAKGLFGGHPHHLGFVGGMGAPQANAAAAGADVVAVFGASLTPWTTERGTLLSQATIVHCDLSPASSATVRVDLPVRGDAAALAAALLAEAGDGRPVDNGWWPPAAEPDRAADHATDDGGLHPAAVVDWFDDVLPAERTVVVDGGHFIAFALPRLRVPDPSGSMLTLDFGSIGLGLPTAIGAAMARPDRRCLLAVGDGGFLMALPELDTAVRERVPLLALVLNDDAYGAEYHHLARHGLATGISTFDSRSIADIAAAMGARTTRIASPADLAALDHRRFDHLDGPHVVEACITRRAVAPTRH
jgi:acetolactate synthase I/II/III large subunit